MGGFTFIGPNYIFENIPAPRTCRCIGFHGEVSQLLETYLLNKRPKILDVAELPDTGLVKHLQNIHLGDVRAYTVRTRRN